MWVDLCNGGEQSGKEDGNRTFTVDPCLAPAHIGSRVQVSHDFKLNGENSNQRVEQAVDSKLRKGANTL